MSIIRYKMPNPFTCCVNFLKFNFLDYWLDLLKLGLIYAKCDGRAKIAFFKKSFFFC